MVKYLGPLLRSAKKPARLYYFETCEANDSDPLAFPRLTVRPPSNGKKGLDAVRDFFGDDKKRVSVLEGRDGIIRVNIGTVSTALLQTKIQLLTLRPDERYTADSAIVAITSTKEVEAAERRLGLDGPPTVYSISFQRPVKGLPHLPAFMRDVTLEQALDAVASTFGGLVLYGECASRSGRHFFRVDWVELRGTENRPD